MNRWLNQNICSTFVYKCNKGNAFVKLWISLYFDISAENLVAYSIRLAHKHYKFVINQIIRMFLYLYYIYVRILTSLVILSFKKFINFKGRTSQNYIMTRIIYNLNRHKRVIFINHFSFSTTCRPCMM